MTRAFVLYGLNTPADTTYPSNALYVLNTLPLPLKAVVVPSGMTSFLLVANPVCEGIRGL